MVTRVSPGIEPRCRPEGSSEARDQGNVEFTFRLDESVVRFPRFYGRSQASPYIAGSRECVGVSSAFRYEEKCVCQNEVMQ